jgi:hypothetical protein
LSVCTCSVDSGRTAGTRPIKCRSVAPGVGKTEAPAIGLSKLNSMAFRLAVYASPDGLPTYDARLASGRWSSSTGRAFHPQDSYERFQICFLHLIPLSQACLAQSHRLRALRGVGPTQRSTWRFFTSGVTTGARCCRFNSGLQRCDWSSERSTQSRPVQVPARFDATRGSLAA